MSKAAPRKFDAHEDQVRVGQDRPRDMSTTGDAMDSLDPRQIEVVTGPEWKDLAEELAFMEELVEVIVHTTSDKQAPICVETWCNGRAQRFIRNRPIVVKRKYVEVLARAKEVSYTQEPYKDASGADAIRNVPSTSLRYPFSIRRDDNPKGRDWLTKILAEAAA